MTRAVLGADSAATLDLVRISEPTLVRWAGQCRRHGITGCIDGHWLRRSGGRYSVSEQLREAIYAVHAECLHRSRVSMKTRERLIRQYVRERFGRVAAEIADVQAARVVFGEDRHDLSLVAGRP